MPHVSTLVHYEVLCVCINSSLGATCVDQLIAIWTLYVHQSIPRGHMYIVSARSSKCVIQVVACLVSSALFGVVHTEFAASIEDKQRWFSATASYGLAFGALCAL